MRRHSLRSEHFNFRDYRSSRPEVFCEKSVHRNFAKLEEKYLPQACIFIIKETLAQVVSCEFCEISKNTFSYGTTLVATSVSTEFVYMTSTLILHSFRMV